MICVQSILTDSANIEGINDNKSKMTDCNNNNTENSDNNTDTDNDNSNLYILHATINVFCCYYCNVLQNYILRHIKVYCNLMICVQSNHTDSANIEGINDNESKITHCNNNNTKNSDNNTDSDNDNRNSYILYATKLGDPSLTYSVGWVQILSHTFIVTHKINILLSIF